MYKGKNNSITPSSIFSFLHYSIVKSLLKGAHFSLQNYFIKCVNYSNTPDQQYTMGLTFEMKVSINMTELIHPIFEFCSYTDSVCGDVVTQGPWYEVHPWCLSGDDIGQELTVPVQQLYCVGERITHQDV